MVINVCPAPSSISVLSSGTIAVAVYNAQTTFKPHSKLTLNISNNTLLHLTGDFLWDSNTFQKIKVLTGSQLIMNRTPSPGSMGSILEIELFEFRELSSSSKRELISRNKL